MKVIPNDLAKMNKEIQKSMDIYAIMDSFNYKFQDEDFKNKWVVYGGAKRILDIIEE